MGPNTDQLLKRAAAGSSSAVNQLFTRHRNRLRKMVAARLHDGMRGRIDPSDVIQETLAEAQRKLAQYIRERPIDFYPWLRQMAWNRLIDLYRQHVLAEKRSVHREASQLLSSDSLQTMVAKLVSPDTSPVEQLLHLELLERMRIVLQQLPEIDREIVVLRHVEHLSVAEVSQSLNLPEGTVKSRHFRALQQIRRKLDAE